jgi:hypothetical protein
MLCDAGNINMRFDTAKLDRRELCIQASLLAISVTVVAVWVFAQPIVFTHDTFTYMDVAREFASGRSTNSYYFRLPIYPALLWTFHITDLSHSVFWLIIFQSFLAVASVWLFYLSARLLEPRGAFIVSLLFVASFLPFSNVKYIMTEQTFLFETMLALYGLIAYLMARSTRESLLAIMILIVGAALMMLTRPQGAFVGSVLLFTTAVLAWRRAWIPAIGAVLLITLVWSVQAIDHRSRSGSWNSAGNFDNTHTVGKQLFFTLYLEAPSKVNIRVSPENGPATAELKRLLLEEAVKPDNSARKKGHFSHIAPDQLPAYIAGIFDGPDSNLYWAAFYGLDERLGLAGADQLLLRVSLEAARAYPLQTIWLFLQKAFDVYFNPLELAVPLHPEFPSGAFRPPLSEEIAAAGDFTNATEFDWAVDRNARWMMRAAILAAILTLPIALRYPTWRVTIALLVFGLYLNTPIVVGTMPLFRYALYAIPVHLMCAFLGIVCVISARWPLRLGLYSKVGDGSKG